MEERGWEGGQTGGWPKWWTYGWTDGSSTVLRIYEEEYRSAASLDKVITETRLWAMRVEEMDCKQCLALMITENRALSPIIENHPHSRYFSDANSYIFRDKHTNPNEYCNNLCFRFIFYFTKALMQYF